MKKVKYYVNRKGLIMYEQTPYGSFVDVHEYGMAQQKNTMSEKELIKLGYKPYIGDKGLTGYTTLYKLPNQ